MRTAIGAGEMSLLNEKTCLAVGTNSLTRNTLNGTIGMLEHGTVYGGCPQKFKGVDFDARHFADMQLDTFNLRVKGLRSGFLFSYGYNVLNN